MCLHVEVYGCDDGRAFDQFSIDYRRLRLESLKNKPKTPVSQASSMKHDKNGNDEKKKGSPKKNEPKRKGKNKIDFNGKVVLIFDRRNEQAVSLCWQIFCLSA